MPLVISLLIAASWLGCGIAAAVIDKRRYPQTVVAGLDESFRAFMIVMGPMSLAIGEIVSRDLERQRRSLSPPTTPSPTPAALADQPAYPALRP